MSRSLRIVQRIFLALAALFVVAAVIIGVILWRWTNGPLPQTSGTIEVAGLQDSVEILRDADGIPSIYASNMHDLVFAQGYVQAQDRWWQMEFSRHVARGRVEELTGRTDSLIGTDIFIRSVGWQQAAERDLANTSPESITLLQNYADGVNAYLDTRSAGALAFEYNILNVTGVSIEIEPWTPLDTLAWAKVMSWDLAGNMSSEMVRAELYDTLGQPMTDDYAPPYPYDERVTVLHPDNLQADGTYTDWDVASDAASSPVGTRVTRSTAPATDAVMNTSAGDQTTSSTETSVENTETAHTYRLAGSVPADQAFLFGKGDGIGSNNWVVSGEKMASGNATLANDPHLSIGMPNLFYQIGLFCRPVSDACPLELTGFALPEFPLILIGHNADIAWGLTNVGWDTQDLYQIEINPDDPFQYRWQDGWRDMTIRNEVISFGDGAEPVELQIRETVFGPIINDYQIDDDGTILGHNNDNPMALRWTGLDGGTLFEGYLALNSATDWPSFLDALSLWSDAAQNIVYIDTDGNIGHKTPGSIPVRAAGHTGLVPVAGVDETNQWLGYVPYENLPGSFNPERGYIATANQALVPLEFYNILRDTIGDDYPEDANYSFGSEWAYGYRSTLINNYLSSHDDMTVDDFEALQGSSEMLVAAAYLPMLDSLSLDGQYDEIRDWLMDWDTRMDADSARAGLFGRFWQLLMDNLFQDQLGDVTEATGGGASMYAAEILLQQSDNIWWDDSTTADRVETRDEALQAVFTQAVDEMTEAYGDDYTTWRWGDLHTVTFVSNPLGLSGIDAIEGIVNRGPYPVSGGPSMLNATGWNDDLTVRAHPVLRYIVDMQDPDDALGIFSTGQSGHPFSPNYDSFVQDWIDIRYHPLYWSDTQVEAATDQRLTLNPETSD